MTAIEAARAPALSYDSDKPPERIEDDIVRTRRHLEATLGELERRLAPQQMIDTAKERLLRSLQGDSEQLFSALRDNAVPVFLIAAGLAWLLLAGKSTAKIDGAGAGPENRPEMPPVESALTPVPGLGAPAAPLAPEPVAAAPALGGGIIGSEMEREVAAPPFTGFDRAAAGDKPALAPATPLEPEAPNLEDSR